MNSVSIIGRFVAEPELRFTNSGTAVLSARVAVNGAGPFISESEGYEAGFFNVVVWGKQAETTAEFCGKGREVGIEGRLQSRTYDNNEGQRVYVTEVVANRVHFLREPQGLADSPQDEAPQKQQWWREQSHKR